MLILCSQIFIGICLWSSSGSYNSAGYDVFLLRTGLSYEVPQQEAGLWRTDLQRFSHPWLWEAGPRRRRRDP
jgi:hypothetical protein